MSQNLHTKSSDIKNLNESILNLSTKDYKKIIFAGIFGLIIGAMFLWINPINGSAIAEFKLGKYESLIGQKYIEEPNELMLRLNYIKNFDQDITLTCSKNTSGFFKKSKISFHQNSKNESYFEIKADNNDLKKAVSCVYEIYKKIKEDHDRITKEIKLNTNLDIIENQKKIQDIKKYIQNNNQLLLVEIINRDINSLNEKNSQLKNLIKSLEQNQTKLINPIYIRNQGNAAKEIATLIAFIIFSIVIVFLLMIYKKSHCMN